jgi:Ca-activated chloride channel family protein
MRRKSSWSLQWIVCWTSLGGVALSAWGLQEPSRFRSQAELVLLPVTARDQSGRVVRDLVAADFRIFENGRPQQLTVFSGDHIPTAISLLLDTSASMEPNLPATQAAASAIIERLGQADVCQVVAFNSTTDIRQDFTHDHQLLRRAIETTHANGATALYNSVYIALRALQKQRPSGQELRREAIILLSDGDDTASLVEFDQVLEAARRSQTLIYTIGLQIGSDPYRLRSGDGPFVLRRLAEDTGGRAYFINDVRQLDAIYTEIYEAIAASYTLGYVPVADAAGGDWRALSVAVDRPGVVAKTRAGYYRH